MLCPYRILTGFGAAVRAVAGAAKPRAVIEHHRLVADGAVRRFFSREGAQDVKDRKSTRLNSSHGYISYAVFCLKKKKQNQKQPTTYQRTTRSWRYNDTRARNSTSAATHL